MWSRSWNWRCEKVLMEAERGQFIGHRRVSGMILAWLSCYVAQSSIQREPHCCVA